MKRVVLLAVLVVCGACSTAVSTPDASELPVANNGGALEQGVTYRYRFFIHCGMRYLESFSGTAWVTDEPIYRGSGRAPDPLREFLVDPDEVISPVLWTRLTLVNDTEIALMLPDGSQSSTYRPTDEELPGCA